MANRLENNSLIKSINQATFYAENIQEETNTAITNGKKYIGDAKAGFDKTEETVAEAVEAAVEAGKATKEDVYNWAEAAYQAATKAGRTVKKYALKTWDIIDPRKIGDNFNNKENTGVNTFGNVLSNIDNAFEAFGEWGADVGNDLAD